ncbi:MAG: hypothetical protein BGO21_13430 [Dyadobacter sp. 50-39]|uniref:hypothetical protein n=1 Tax=Dyadobacter sp. 50-39 TaxID=1895756 RepID=UPI00095A0B2C|nr:hypothetical protein [Dyadobacter sp. 50-39]OJV17463.1 MAG: hypothetical protein BGO21_13430 [Dyadobacter sp. 50-39]
MKTERWLVLCVVSLLIQLVACERGKLEENTPAPVSARTGADSMKVDSISYDTIRNDTIWKDSILHDTIPRDTIIPDTTMIDSTIADSTFSDSLGSLRQSARSGAALARLKSIHRK